MVVGYRLSSAGPSDRGVSVLSFLSPAELEALGVVAGRDVLVSTDARLFGADRIRIGDNVRIDAFCVISAGGSGHVHLGSHIHIASGTRVFGDGGVDLGDFSSISSGSTLYSASDDYSGRHLIGPTIPDRYLAVDKRPIRLDLLAAIGAHSVVMPGVTLNEGAVLGAMSMARRSLDPWTIYAGVPCVPLRAREQDALQLSAAARAALDTR